MSLLERLSEAQLAKVYKAIDYSEKSLEEDLERLKLWVQRQTHFPPEAQQEPDMFFKTYLVVCKGKLEVVKKKIDSYYTSRSTLSHMFLPLDPMDKEFLKTTTYMHSSILPKAMPDGCRITFAVYPESDPEIYNVIATVKRFLVNQEMWLREEGIMAGMWVILDIKDYTFNHIVKITPTIIRDFMNYIEGTFAVRIKGFVAINAAPWIENAVNTIIKPFIPKKLADRNSQALLAMGREAEIYIYSGTDRLAKHFPIEILPKEYGGKEKSAEELSKLWLESAMKKREWFLSHLAGTCDEGKRVQQLNPDFIQGSFRKLNID